MIITSNRNPLLQRVRALSRRREREAQNLALAEGVRLVEEALASGCPLAFWLATPELAERGQALVEQLQARAVPGSLVEAGLFERLTDTQSPQGILVAFEPRAWQLSQLAPGLLVVADGIADPGNLGTLIRTAEALGAVGLATTPGSVDFYNPKVVRAAMGALFRLPLLSLDLEDGAQSHPPIVIAEADGEHLPWQVDLTQPTWLIVGNEAHGPSEAARNLASYRVRIPMVGGAESLNVATAASLLLYEALRQQG